MTDVLTIIMAWAITFTAVCTLILCLGFGPAGIGAGRRSPFIQIPSNSIKRSAVKRRLIRNQGTIAAAFQSYMYGAFTPAGGIFATLTSMAMLGTMMPPAAILAVVIATGVAILVWVWGIGR